jgi:hypothetical protein
MRPKMGDPFLHLLICSFIGQVSFLSQTPFLIGEVLQLLPQIAITPANNGLNHHPPYYYYQILGIFIK